jgi:hypothetical protein
VLEFQTECRILPVGQRYGFSAATVDELRNRESADGHSIISRAPKSVLVEEAGRVATTAKLLLVPRLFIPGHRRVQRVFFE